MVRDITIGQYYPAKSAIHRLDPRVKIVCTLLFLISLFIQRSILGYVVATLFLGAVIYTSRVPFKFIVKGLKPIMILLLITVLFNLFLTRGGAELVHFWIFHITEKGLETSRIYGDPLDLPDHGIVHYDVYHNAKLPDGRD